MDELGGIKAAIAYAAKRAGLANYRTVDYPKKKDLFEELLGSSSEEIETRTMKANLGQQYMYVKQLKNVLSLKGVQERLPYEMIIE